MFLPTGLMVTFKRIWFLSDDLGGSSKTLLPRSHAPVSSSNLSAEHPTVEMHIVVQCSDELEIKRKFKFLVISRFKNRLLFQRFYFSNLNIKWFYYNSKTDLKLIFNFILSTVNESRQISFFVKEFSLYQH